MVHGSIDGFSTTISRYICKESTLLIENIIDGEFEMCLSMQEAPIYVGIPDKARTIHGRNNIAMVTLNSEIGLKCPVGYFITSCEIRKIGPQAIIVVECLTIVAIAKRIRSSQL